MPETILESVPSNKVYPLVLSYLERKHKLKVLRFQEPSLIIVKIGSYWAMGRGFYNPVGILNISLIPKNEGTNIKVEFDFTKFYAIVSIFTSFLSVGFLYVLLNYLSKGMLEAAFIWAALVPIGIILAAYFTFKRVEEVKTNFMRKFKRLLKKIS